VAAGVQKSLTGARQEKHHAKMGWTRPGPGYFRQQELEERPRMSEAFSHGCW